MKKTIKKRLAAIIALSNEAKRVTNENFACNNLKALNNRINERLQNIIDIE